MPAAYLTQSIPDSDISPLSPEEPAIDRDLLIQRTKQLFQNPFKWVYARSVVSWHGHLDAALRQVREDELTVDHRLAVHLAGPLEMAL